MLKLFRDDSPSRAVIWCGFFYNARVLINRWMMFVDILNNRAFT